MRATLATLWKEHRLLLAGFVVALFLTLLFATRFTVQAVYFAHHRDVTLAGWMPLGYVAHSYGVDPGELKAALDVPDGLSMRTPLQKIATTKARPLEVLEADILDSVARLRGTE